MDDLIQALNNALERRGISAAAASKAAVGNPSAIKNISALLRREPTERATALQNLVTIADYLGLELQLGLPSSTNLKDRPTSTHEDFAFVQRYDIQLSAGPGGSSDQADRLAPVAFRKDWLSQSGLIANKCVVCSVSGDSMQPLLFDGDLVLIDRRSTDLRNGQVYAVTDISGDVRIKRLEVIEGGILLRSDNPTSSTEARIGQDANRIEVIGRLVWSSHSHRPMRSEPAASK